MNRRDVLTALSLAAGLVVLLIPFARLGVDAHHDGIMLKPALDVLSGQVLFRDTFSQYGALTTYLQVAALWIHLSLLSLRVQTVAAYGVALFFLYAAWRLILPRPLTVVSCGVFVLFIPVYEKNWVGDYWLLLPWSSAFSLMFQGIGLQALLKLVAGSPARRWGWILGAACSCTFWCRQPVGIFMSGCVVVTWIGLHWTGWSPARSNRAILIETTGGFLLVHLGMFSSILLFGAATAWWYQNFEWPRKFASEYTLVSWDRLITIFIHPLAGLGLILSLTALVLPAVARRLKPAWTGLIIYYLGLAAVLAWWHESLLHWLEFQDGGWTVFLPFLVASQAVICLILAFRARRPVKDAEYHLTASLTVMSLGSLLQYYPVPDSWHIFWSLGPAFGLFVHLFWRWSGWSVATVTLVLVAVFLAPLYAKFSRASVALNRPLVTLTQPLFLKHMKVPAEQARAWKEITLSVESILRHQPEIPSVLSGYDALFLCFTTNRSNPSPYYVTWPKLAEHAAIQERWSHIEAIRPLMFFHKADWLAVNAFYKRARYVPLLYVEEMALEIAIPQELADAMGRKAYDASPAAAPAKTATP